VELLGVVVAVGAVVVAVAGVVVAVGAVVGAVGVEVVIDVAVAVAVGVLTGVDAAQVGRDTVLESSVTAALRASSRPVTEAPVLAVTEVRARTVPTNAEVVPSVAELPTCQNTLHAVAPLSSRTRLPDAVITVLAAWKMNTAVGSPSASRLNVPVRPNAPPRYTPDTSVCPPRSAVTVAVGARPAASS
jgi:hypothetical protein